MASPFKLKGKASLTDAAQIHPVDDASDGDGELENAPLPELNQLPSARGMRSQMSTKYER